MLWGHGRQYRPSPLCAPPLSTAALFKLTHYPRGDCKRRWGTAKGGLMRKIGLAIGMTVAVGACAGRAPQPVAVVQPQDRYSDCAAITAEIEPTTKRSASLLPSKASRSVKTSPPGLRAWWFGRCSLPWIFRIQPARKSPRCKVASNTLRAWRSRNALLPHRRILLRFASTDRAAAGREETSPTDFGAADFGARDLYWAGSLRDRRVRMRRPESCRFDGAFPQTRRTRRFLFPQPSCRQRSRSSEDSMILIGK